MIGSSDLNAVAEGEADAAVGANRCMIQQDEILYYAARCNNRFAPLTIIFLEPGIAKTMTKGAAIARYRSTEFLALLSLTSLAI